ncbi:N-alpha-acetyltransferase 25, NatB auxiliary subunit, partial [Geodia barretti]
MGRQEEGNSLIDEVVKACPGDQATLQAATMYYRETGDGAEPKVVDLYTQAAEQYPGNQEILTHLFMAFVRVGNYHKQQQTALQLHKAFPDNGPYYCWRVMSIVMQAHKSTDGSLANSMFLPLAEKLMEKYVAEKKLDVEEEVKLYLMVLEKQGKPEKRLEVVQGPLGKLIRKREERNRLELECHLSLQRWDDAVRLLTAMLRENPDHWKDIEVYISCQIERYKESVREAKEEHEMKKRGRE